MKIFQTVPRTLFLLFLLTSSPASFAAKPLALVWTGPGACWPDCWPSAVTVAHKAGFRVKHVNPHTKDFSIFKKASVWIQPGGHSWIAAQAMGPELIDHIRQFVAGGGGYVGFCAGMFITTPLIGTTGKPGFGIVPGHTELYLKDDPPAQLLPVTTEFGTLHMFYAGGPFIELSEAEARAYGVEILARYSDGKIAGIRSHYGHGRIAVTGFHPEMGNFWKWRLGMHDQDGNDHWFAIKMLKYVTSRQ